MTKYRIYVHNVPDIFPFHRPLFHQLHCFPRDNTKTQNIRLHDVTHLGSVVIVEDQAFCDDIRIVNQQIDSVKLLADISEHGLNLMFIFNVTLEWEKLAFHAEQSRFHCLRREDIFVEVALGGHP